MNNCMVFSFESYIVDKNICLHRFLHKSIGERLMDMLRTHSYFELETKDLGPDKIFHETLRWGTIPCVRMD